MIPNIFFGGSFVCLCVWVAGLLQMGRMRSRLSHGASLAAIVISLGTIASAIYLPRSHWALGNMGGGDGFGLVGLIFFAGIAFVAALVTFAVTEIVRAAIARRARKIPDNAS